MERVGAGVQQHPHDVRVTLPRRHMERRHVRVPVRPPRVRVRRRGRAATSLPEHRLASRAGAARPGRSMWNRRVTSRVGRAQSPNDAAASRSSSVPRARRLPRSALNSSAAVIARIASITGRSTSARRVGRRQADRRASAASGSAPSSSSSATISRTILAHREVQRRLVVLVATHPLFERRRIGAPRFGALRRRVASRSPRRCGGARRG